MSSFVNGCISVSYERRPAWSRHINMVRARAVPQPAVYQYVRKQSLPEAGIMSQSPTIFVNYTILSRIYGERCFCSSVVTILSRICGERCFCSSVVTILSRICGELCFCSSGRADGTGRWTLPGAGPGTCSVVGGGAAHEFDEVAVGGGAAAEAGLEVERLLVLAGFPA